MIIDTTIEQNRETNKPVGVDVFMIRWLADENDLKYLWYLLPQETLWAKEEDLFRINDT